MKRLQRENASARRHIAFLAASRDELEQRTRSLSQQLDLYIFHSNSRASPSVPTPIVTTSNGDAGSPPTPQVEDTIDVTLAAEKIREMQLKLDRSPILSPLLIFVNLVCHRLAANNKVLILELEDKRQAIHKYSKKTKHLQRENIFYVTCYVQIEIGLIFFIYSSGRGDQATAK
jgi:hypothetical protein